MLTIFSSIALTLARYDEFGDASENDSANGSHEKNGDPVGDIPLDIGRAVHLKHPIYMTRLVSFGANRLSIRSNNSAAPGTGANGMASRCPDEYHHE